MAHFSSRRFSREMKVDRNISSRCKLREKMQNGWLKVVVILRVRKFSLYCESFISDIFSSHLKWNCKGRRCNEIDLLSIVVSPKITVPLVGKMGTNVRGLNKYQMTDGTFEKEKRRILCSASINRIVHKYHVSTLQLSFKKKKSPSTFISVASHSQPATWHNSQSSPHHLRLFLRSKSYKIKS